MQVRAADRRTSEESRRDDLTSIFNYLDDEIWNNRPTISIFLNQPNLKEHFGLSTNMDKIYHQSKLVNADGETFSQSKLMIIRVTTVHCSDHLHALILRRQC